MRAVGDGLRSLRDEIKENCPASMGESGSASTEAEINTARV